MEKRSVICSCSDLCVRIGDQRILERAGFTVHEGERVGVLGINGCGKSTLLRILAGVMPPDDGAVDSRRDLVSGYLPQEAEFERHASVREAILDGARDLREMAAHFETLSPHSDEAHRLEDELYKRGGWELDRLADEFASHLALPELNRCIDHLSGGEKRRVALARALIGAPELLLLDEPTNHLDTESIAWLATWLVRQPTTCLFVTHDRAFLDDVATRTLEIDHGSVFMHEGNYSDFLTAKSRRQEVEARLEDKRQSFIKREVEWIRRGPKARTTKSQSRIDRFNDAVSQSPPSRPGTVDLIIPPAGRLGGTVLEFSTVDIEIGGQTLVRDFSFCFEPGQRIGIVGRNGAGKTTLLKTILGDHPPARGTIIRGEKTRFNYADQQRRQLNDENDAFTEIAEGKESVQLGAQTVSVWAYLKRFLFTDERIRTQVGRLSGGERNRLMLAKILKYGGNFLILDEPTNDLDLDTLRILEEALVDFGGCVLVVSHDRYFLNRVCTGIFAFEGDGSLFYQEGDYDYYLSKRAEREAREPSSAAPAGATRSSSKRSRPKARKLTWKEKREAEGMEEAILAAEAEVERLHDLFAAADFYEKHGSDIPRLNEKLKAAEHLVAQLYARWEELEAAEDG
ncbi:MAG: ABC-F family ATP-binding cassette domain-containing protein [Verrucomicrobiota bacterium]